MTRVGSQHHSKKKKMDLVDGGLLRRLFYPHGRRPPLSFRRRPGGHQILSDRFEEEKKLLFALGILL